MTITKERLLKIQQWRETYGQGSNVVLPAEEAEELARIALASLEAEKIAEPVAKVETVGVCWYADNGVPRKPAVGTELYAAPPVPVVDADDNFYSWFGREWHKHYQQNQYTTAAKQMLGVMAESAWKAGRRAAMLQGSEPVSNRDEFPLDYLQGHKDGLEWAAQLAEANHPQTGDWLYDDPIELAKAIRKGPDMPELKSVPADADDNFYSWFCREWEQNYQPNGYSLSAKKHLGAIAESAWFACRAAMLQWADGNSPDGWVACSPEWIERNGAHSCSDAPRIAFGSVGNHYHPYIFHNPKREVKP